MSQGISRLDVTCLPQYVTFNVIFFPSETLPFSDASGYSVETINAANAIDVTGTFSRLQFEDRHGSVSSSRRDQPRREQKIVFNAPYDDKITNAGDRRIRWAIKTINMRRLGVRSTMWCSRSQGERVTAISCDTFNAATEDLNNDSITIECTNTPDGATKQLHRESFQDDGIVRRKNLPIEYNLQTLHVRSTLQSTFERGK